MKTKHSFVTALFVPIIGLFMAWDIISCGTTTASPTPSASATAFSASGFVGTWTGTWTNTTYSTTGAGKVTVVATSSTVMTFSVDMDGSVFGGSNPASEDFTGTVSSTKVTADAKTSTVYGAISGSMSSDGTFTITGTSVPGQVSAYTMTGTWTSTKITAALTISFDAGGANAAATLTGTKQ